MIRRVPRLLGCLLTASAFAFPVLADDARIATHAYNQDEIVKLEGKMNVQATISFAEGERIENVAVGDPDSWQIVPNKRADLLFVKPLLAAARTNMTVVTDRRTYFFDLVASATAKPVYALRFTYPGAVAPAVSPPPQVAAATPPSVASAPAAQAADLAEIEATRREVLADAGSASVPPSPSPQVPARTVAPPASAPAPVAMPTIAVPASPTWRRSGADKLLPARLRDDGVSTFIQWAPGVPIPSLFTVDAGGRESPLAYAVQGEEIVIDSVPPKIVLRASRARAILERVPALPPAPRAGQSAMASPVGRDQPASE